MVHTMRMLNKYLNMSSKIWIKKIKGEILGINGKRENKFVKDTSSSSDYFSSFPIIKQIKDKYDSTCHNFFVTLFRKLFFVSFFFFVIVTTLYFKNKNS